VPKPASTVSQISTLKLFSSIIVNRRQLPPGESSKELLQVIQHIVRKFVSGLESNPLLGIEVGSGHHVIPTLALLTLYAKVFFAKTRHECRVIEMTADELLALEAKKLADVS
jgi:hypothetical protein